MPPHQNAWSMMLSGSQAVVKCHFDHSTKH